jgi:transposase
VFNADLVGAYNILITPSPERDRGNGLKTRPGIKPLRGGVIPNLPAFAGTLTL